MTFVSALEPKPVWSHFDTILTIPRASKDEERMRRHVIAAAGAAGCDHVIDDAGNVVVRKAATAGHEGAPVTILQSHLDMVQEKNADVAFDFRTDAIVPRREGAHLYATGTTLGSDNGIGVAAMLAVMDSTDLAHGPLELLFTIDEETGLTGAAQLDAGLLAGRRLINLDSEEEGILYVGCAGGGDMRLSLGVTAAGAGSGDRAVTVALRGLKGGHSGCDIHLQRGNAVCLLARALWAAHAGTPFRLARLEGGSAHNAIPREAFATIVAAASDVDSIASAVRTEFESFREEYRPADPGMTLDIGDAAAAKQAWDADATATVLRLVSSLPHGVEAMSYDIPGLVETSNKRRHGQGFERLARHHHQLALIGGRGARRLAPPHPRDRRARRRGRGRAPRLPGLEAEHGVRGAGGRQAGSRAGTGNGTEGRGDSRRTGVRHHRQEDPRHGHDLVRPGHRGPPLPRRAGPYRLGGALLPVADRHARRAGVTGSTRRR